MTVQMVRFSTTEANVADVESAIATMNPLPAIPAPVTVLGTYGLFA